MKVAELKEELEVRGEATSGNKSWLRRRLHAAIVREHLERADLHMDIFGRSYGESTGLTSDEDETVS